MGMKSGTLRYLPGCGASLTLKLAAERKSLAEAYGLENNKLSLLFEDTRHYQALNQQIEIVQLNEVLYPYYLMTQAMGEDLYTRIVRETIKELREKGLVEEDSILLQEGFWDWVQSGVGNFAGGADKILKKVKLKKEPEGWEEAQRVFKKVAEKEGHKVVQDLVKAIEDETRELETGLGTKAKNQQFPVNKTRNIFFSGVNTIASVYDSIVAATKKKAGEDGHMPVDVANEIIQQLRIITMKYMADAEREKGGMYATFGGGEASQGLKGTPTGEADEYDEEVLAEQDEDEDVPEGTDTGEELDPDAEYEKIMRGQDSPVFQRMTSLKAPLVIAGVGAALGAMGWLAYQPWFHEFVLNLLDIPKDVDIVGKPKIVMQQIKERMIEANPSMSEVGEVVSGGGGFREQATRLLNLGGADSLMGPDASLADLKNAAEIAGGGNVGEGLKNLSGMMGDRGNPTEAFEWMSKAIADPSSIGVENLDDPRSLGALFAGGTGRGGGIASRALFPGEDIFSVDVGAGLQQTIVKNVVKTVTRNVAKKVAGTVVKGTGATALSTVAMMTSAAPILAGLGVAAIGAGAALALIRQRGKKASRMGTFNMLLQALKEVPPQPVPEVEVEPGEESVVTITLYNIETEAPGEAPKTEGRNRWTNRLIERTEIEITGLAGDEELEQTGGVAKFNLDPVPLEVPPAVDSIDQIPYVIQGINEFLPDFDLGAENVTVKIIDKRTAEEIPEEPPKEETPPIPLDPATIAKGNNAVVVFDPEGARVWRILKKKTFQKYASDAKKSGDKDAPEFADRYAKYDNILAKLRADGVFVNSDDLENELSKISSGNDGDQYRVTYTRTRKDKKTGKKKKRKSSTGGYTDAGSLANIGDIHKNIKGAPGSRPPKDVNKFTVIYLVGSNILRGLQDAGLKEKQAKIIANNAIAKWANTGKRPKIADLGVKDDDVIKALKGASLAEALGMRTRHRYAVVEVTNKFFNRVLRDLRESRGSSINQDRFLAIAGL